MADTLLRMLLWVTLALALVLLLRRPARRAFGAGAAFTLWLLVPALLLAPLWPSPLAPAAMRVLPALQVAPQGSVGVSTTGIAIDLPRWLALVWFAGAMIALVRLALCFARLRAAAGVASSALCAQVERAAPAFDVRRVRTHPAGPAVLWALPRPWLLLPVDFAQRYESAAARDLVLRHELTHARRGDAWWTLAMEVACAVLWFHPLAWWARARFRLDQELACDAAALRQTPQGAPAYARALLCSIAVQPVPALIPWLAEPQLKERLHMLTKGHPGALRRRAGFVAVAGFLAGGLALAGGPAAVAVQAATSPSSAYTPPAVDITYKNRNPPHYPVASIKKGEQGRVNLDVTIDASGSVVDVRIDQRGTNAPAALQVAAAQAARNWKFNPGVMNGKAVGGVIRIPVDFSLHGVPAHLTAAPCPAGDVYDSALDHCVKPPVAPASH